MKIYYPSTSPVVNKTYAYLPESTTTIVVASVAVGIGSIAAIGFAIRHFLKPKPPPIRRNPRAADETARIEIPSSDLKEIQELLNERKKIYRVL
jgi:hypothetical protein